MPSTCRQEDPAIDPPATEQPQASLSDCPRCHAAMLTRIARRTGDAFLGCSRFPACRGTRSLAPALQRGAPGADDAAAPG